MSHSSAIADTDVRTGEPKGNSGVQLWKETKTACHLAAIRLQPLPTVSPEETQDVKTQDTDPG